MKTISAFLFLWVVVLTAAKIENTGNAKVQKLYGIDVYVYSEPTIPYDTIESKNVNIAGCKDWVTKPARLAAETPNATGVIVSLPTKIGEGLKYVAIKYK